MLVLVEIHFITHSREARATNKRLLRELSDYAAISAGGVLMKF